MINTINLKAEFSHFNLAHTDFVNMMPHSAYNFIMCNMHIAWHAYFSIFALASTVPEVRVQLYTQKHTGVYWTHSIYMMHICVFPLYTLTHIHTCTLHKLSKILIQSLMWQIKGNNVYNYFDIFITILFTSYILINLKCHWGFMTLFYKGIIKCLWPCLDFTWISFLNHIADGALVCMINYE